MPVDGWQGKLWNFWVLGNETQKVPTVEETQALLQNEFDSLRFPGAGEILPGQGTRCRVARLLLLLLLPKALKNPQRLR